MKKTLLALFLALTPASFTLYAGGDAPQQVPSLIQQHIPLLCTYACAQLPPLKKVCKTHPILPLEIMASAYEHKQLLTETPKPWESWTFRNSEHFWLSLLRTPQNKLPEVGTFIYNEECSRSFLGHIQAPNIDVQEQAPTVQTLNNKALRVAAYWNVIGKVKACLDAGADIHAEDDAALILAAQKGHTETVKLLINAGANIHAEDDDALIYAAENGHSETIKLLVIAGADINAQDGDALYWAAKNGHAETAKTLLTHGANAQAKNDSALYQAALNGHAKTVKTLLDNGADIHAKNDRALLYAAENGHTKTVKMLLDHGADVHALDTHIPQWSAENSHQEIRALLEVHE